MSTITGPGLIYNGSAVNGLANMNWWKQNGIYCLRPGWLDQCPGAVERYKIGMAAGSSSRQLGVRLSNHSSALVSMSLMFICTVSSTKVRTKTTLKSNRKRKNPNADNENEKDIHTEKSMASILEQEAFAFLQANGIDRVLHESGRGSEYFSDVPLSLLRALFDHLTTITSIPLNKKNKWMPQIKDAYWFGDENAIQGNGMNKPPSRFEYGYLLPTQQELNRRRLSGLLQSAVDNGDKDLEEDLKAQLESLLSMSYVDVKFFDGGSDDDDDDKGSKTETKDDDDDGGGGGMTFVDISDSDLYSDEDDTSAAPVAPDPGTIVAVASMTGSTPSAVATVLATASLVTPPTTRRSTRRTTRSSGLRLRSGRVITSTDITTFARF